MVLARPRGSESLGYAAFLGPHPADSAHELALLLSYVPVDLLHLAVRRSKNAAHRFYGLIALRDVCAAPDSSTTWTPSFAATVRAALEDDDEDVQRAAQAYDQADVPDVTETPLRLASPIFNVLSFDELISAFSAHTTVVRRTDALLELKLTSSDTRMVLVYAPASVMYGAFGNGERTARIGAAFFTGPQAEQIAIDFAPALAYFPRELALRSLRESQNEGFRARALMALGMAELPVIPSSGPSPEFEAAIEAGRADPSALVAATALIASELPKSGLDAALAALEKLSRGDLHER
jgi:hypothetical protein